MAVKTTVLYNFQNVPAPSNSDLGSSQSGSRRVPKVSVKRTISGSEAALNAATLKVRINSPLTSNPLSSQSEDRKNFYNKEIIQNPF